MAIRRSYFILDLGGNAWDKTSGYLSSIGYECHRVSFTDSNKRNSSIDPLRLIRVGTEHEENDVNDTVSGIMGAKGTKLTENENFFYTQSHAAIAAGALFARLAHPVEKQNLPAVARLFTPTAKEGPQQRIDRMLTTKHDPDYKYGYVDENGKPSQFHPTIMDTFNELRHMHGDTLKSVMTNVQRYLRPFRNKMVAQALDGLSVPPDRFFHPTLPPIAFFICIAAGSKKSLRGVVCPIVETYMQAWQSEDREGSNLYVEVIADEMDSWSPIGILRDDAQVVRKNHVTLHSAFQGYNQIYDKYGQYQMVEASHTVQIIMTPADRETKNKISSDIGQFTYAIKGPERDGKSEPIEKTRTRIYPDEVGRMPNNRAIVFKRGVEPVYVYLPFYFEDKVFLQRSLIPPPFGPNDAEKQLLEDENTDAVGAQFEPEIPDDQAYYDSLMQNAWSA